MFRSNRGECVTPVFQRNIRGIQQTPQKICMKRSIDNFQFEVITEFEVSQDIQDNYEVLICENLVVVRTKYGYKSYKPFLINNRWFIKEIKNHWTFNNEIEHLCDLIIYSPNIKENDIEFYLNLLYHIPYNHEDLYLPQKQDLSDLWLIDEEEILGPFETINDYTDNNDEYDVYYDFFHTNINDIETIERNIDNWLPSEGI